MKRIIKILVLIAYCQIATGQQNYFEYHSKINRAEELFANEEFEESLNEYDSVFQKFDYIFIKDYIIAAQVAILNKDQEKTTHWLKQALIKGYDCKCVKRIKVFEDYVNTRLWQDLQSQDENLKKQYQQSINLDLHYEFHHRYKQEQESKRQEDKYVPIVYRNYFRIKSLMDSIPFPSERIIGIDDESIFPTTSGGKLHNCEVSNSKVIPTLLHYDNPITDIGLKKFIAAIESDHLHPRQFAYIYSFETNFVSRLSKNKFDNRPRLPEYCFNYAFGKKTNDLKRVKMDREKFGICSLELEKAKKVIAEKHGLKLDFGNK